MQRAKDPVVVLAGVGGLNQELLFVGIPLLVKIPTKGMMAGEDGMEGKDVDLVQVDPRDDLHNAVVVVLAWEMRGTGHLG